ncbi:MAG: TlpA disulfide reductase family protein [Chloroflexi bacterium]|nr:TlpA disulfide reductase family protein [Chloroflexota bacterium]MDA1227124.1 TlpA disulfide reductase family protein [Chloroflexota bacterium]
MASPSPKRSSSRKRGGQQGSYRPPMIIGSAVIVAIIVGVLTFQILTGSGASADFEFSVYQGEEILGGDPINFSEILDDGKPVVLNFWAGNCPPCRAEMPALQKVWDAHQDDIIFVGLDVGTFTGLGTKQSAIALLDELNVTYPAGGPPNRTPLVNYSVRSMPTTVFFGADGQPFDRWDGAISEFQMNNIISAMLEEAS